MADKSDVKIEIANLSHREGILKQLETNFVLNEPIEQALNTTWDDAKKDWEKVVDDCLRFPHSHVAVNGSNKVVGFRLSRIMDMAKWSPGDSIYEWLSGKVQAVADEVTRRWPEILKDSKNSLQFIALCVHSDYGGQGIALKMCQENLALGKRLGCDSCTVIASNWKSRRVFEKAGFTTIDTLEFANVKDSNGEQVLKVKDPKQKSATFHIMKL